MNNYNFLENINNKIKEFKNLDISSEEKLRIANEFQYKSIKLMMFTSWFTILTLLISVIMFIVFLTSKILATGMISSWFIVFSPILILILLWMIYSKFSIWIGNRMLNKLIQK